MFSGLFQEKMQYSMAASKMIMWSYLVMNEYNTEDKTCQFVHVVARAVESELRSRKDFEPEESESQKFLTTLTPG